LLRMRVVLNGSNMDTRHGGTPQQRVSLTAFLY
jgi:hypothetical protein